MDYPSLSFSHFVMKHCLALLFIFSVLLLISGCSSSKGFEENKSSDEDGVYVFDEVPVEEVSNEVSENADEDTSEEYNYFVQVGAFTTNDNAETFIKSASEILSEELEIIFNSKTSLYQVRVKKAFTSRIEAAVLRDKIRLNENYKDAWIAKTPK